MILLTILLACNGCIACQPVIPNSNNTNQQNQPSQEPGDEDSAETGIIELPCPIMDEEPNGDNDNAQLVSMEEWICGYFTDPADINGGEDFDVFLFGFPEEGWVKVWGRASDIGSMADLILTLDQGTNTAIVAAQYDSTDPKLVVPVDEAGGMYALMQEQNQGYGMDHFYELLISQVKPPVEWTQSENDDMGENDSPFGADVVYDGTRIFGRTSTNTDTDWFRITLPGTCSDEDYTNKESCESVGGCSDGVSMDEATCISTNSNQWITETWTPDQVTLTISVEAFMEGSPLDPTIYLYPESVFDSEIDFNSINYRTIGLNSTENANNLDPIIVYPTDEGGDLGILIQNNVSGGSSFHWYVIEVNITYWD